MRAEGGFQIDRRRADHTGSVTFDDGVELGGYYIAVGVKDRHPFEVRARGRNADGQVEQLPGNVDRPHQMRPVNHVPTAETAAVRQEDVPAGTWQASDTRTGYATPLD
jgi:hypothetical protein